MGQAVSGSKPVRILNDGTSSPEGRLGAIGDIQFVLEREQPQEDLLVLAGDNVLGFGLAGYLDYFHKVDTDCILVRTVDDPAELRSIGVAELDAQNRVLSLEEKPQAPRSNIGVFALYIYKRSTLPLFSRYLAEGATRMRRVIFPNGCIPVRRCGPIIRRGRLMMLAPRRPMRRCGRGWGTGRVTWVKNQKNARVQREFLIPVRFIWQRKGSRAVLGDYL